MKKLFLYFIVFSTFSSFGQTCPTNLSFDANNISFWEFMTGNYNGSYVATYSNTINAIPSKASTVTTANDVFTYNSLSIYKANADGTLTADEVEPSIKKVPVINGYKYNYSVRIGNNRTGGSADKLTFRLTVPTGLNTYNITYAYAAILQDPNHTAGQQPAFAATVSDLSKPAGSQTISCASKRYYSNTSLPTATNDGTARYLSWQEVSFDLSQYAGKTIELKFEAFDCQPTGHYGYAYLAFRNDGCGTGEITGNSLICSNSSSLTYSTPTVDGASFTWTLPYGWTGTSTTNSITVNPNGNAGGNITVTPSQSCGNITTRSLAVTTVNSIPSTPGSITGESTICSNSSNLTYSIASVNNASSYTWTYPSGWTVVSGLNTNSITFNANSSSGNITVKSNNLCGSSSVSSSSISVVNNALSSAGAISGVPGSTLCASAFPQTLTLGTSVGSVTKWLSSTDGGITYQNIANTSSSLAITPTSSTFYKAEVKNGSCIAAQSAAVLVNVYSDIQIDNQPVSINTCAGSAKTFSVTAVGDGTLSYNWQKSTDNGVNWTNISAAPTNFTNYTTATLTVGAALVTSGTNIQFRCIISSSTGCNPKTSSSATLQVSTSVTPTINTSPTDQTVCSGASDYIEVIATGPSLTYQWQSSSSLGGTYANISGQTANQLTLNTASAAVYYYKCVVTEACGSKTATTNPVTITITGTTTTSVTIAANVNNVCYGTPITYTASPLNEGSGPTYAWYKNGSVVSGETASTFISSAIANGDVVYAVLTSNKACAIGSPASSNNVSRTIKTAPTVSVSGTSTNYDLVTLVASGGGTYSWDGGSNVSSASNDFDESGTYTVTVTDATSGCSTSQATVVTVKLKALSRYGELLDVKANQVNRFGEKGSDYPIIKNGQLKKYSKFKVITSNLKLHLDASNSSSYSGSGTTWTDISTTGMSATLTNGPVYSTNNGGYFTFDGTNDYVSLPSAYPGSNDITIEAWIKRAATSGAGVAIANMDNWTSGCVQLQFANNQLQFALNGEADKYANYSFAINNWYHVAAAYDKSAKTIKFYVNGSLINTENYSSPPAIANQPFKIGGWSYNSNMQNYFNGSIGMIRIYSSTLNSTQITNNFNNAKQNFGL